LYETNTKSILEVDSINWRNIDNELPTMESVIDEKINYNTPNIIRNCELTESDEIKGFLKYTNEFKIGDYIYLALDVDYYTYVVSITDTNLNIN